MKMFAAYCRVSTDRQKEEKTIEEQEPIIQEWASKNDSVIVEWYKDDGWSGELLARPDLDRMRDDAGKGKWEGIVFVDRDRLARKLSLQELIIDELKEKNIEIIFLNEPLADNPEGRIMQQIKGVFAEYERAKITERMRRGKMHKAKKGILVGHEAPYGYRYIPKSPEKEGYFVVYEPEAEIVRMIFELVAKEGYSMRKVIKELYKRGISPAKKKSKFWRKSSVERLLNRKDYIGISYYNKTLAVIPKHPQTVGKYKKIKKSSRKVKPKDEWVAIKVPSIITKELFLLAHKQLKENLLLNKRNKKYDYLLTGKIYCRCGSKRVGDGVNGHHYYRCAQRIYKFPLPNKCTYQGVNAEILDEMVWNKFLTYLSNPEVIKTQVEKVLKKKNKIIDGSESQSEHTQRALENLDEEENRYVEAYGAKLITFEKLKDLLGDIKAKKASIETKAEEDLAIRKGETISLDNINEVCTLVFHELQYASAADRQKHLRKLVESIYVGERNSALINGRIPLYNQPQNIQDESECRDSQNVTPQFLAFSFKLRLPPLRKARKIIERNKLGQIAQARAPYVKTRHT